VTSRRGGRDPRRRAREAALQILYQREVGRVSLDEAVETFWSTQDEPRDPDVGRAATALARGTVERLDEIDRLVSETAEHWRIERMAIVDRLVLRLAVFELRFRPDLPPGVVINEALELARRFSSEDAVKFVNGILDAIRKTLNVEAGGGGQRSDEGGAGER
jgi:N utilization substance protein B